MSYSINRVTVIGAGTMGAAIAAHIANAGIPVYLLDIAPRELTPDETANGLTQDHPAVRNRIVAEGWQRCLKARPPNLFVPDAAERVTLGNLEDNFGWVGQAGWIVEAIVEQLDMKRQLMARIEAERRPGSIVSTNTSGIPIKEIAEGRSEDFKAHFLGTHFFNPPRYLRLLEIIPTGETRPEIVEFMKRFATRVLGKGAVVCKDTPSFLANRFLALVLSQLLNHTLDNGFTIEEVDGLTGPIIGHPKTATFRLLDLVGIDIVAHVSGNLYPAIPHDPYREELKGEKTSALIREMLERKWLGSKTGQGFYKEVKTPEGRKFRVLNPATMEYEEQVKPRFESLEANRKVTDAGERIKRIGEADDRAARFTRATTSFACNYAASLVPEVSEEICAIDNACKWGFGHELGPFEIWDALGVTESAARIEAEGMKVTPWVKEMLAAGHTSFYKKENGRLHSYNPAARGYVASEQDPRAISLKDLKAAENRVIARNASASLLDMDDGVLCLEFQSKVNALDGGAFAMMERARDELDKDWAGMVIGNQGPHFCAGADLNMFVEQAEKKDWDAMDAMIREAQDIVMSFRYSPKPVVSAPFNMVLGGGAEVMMEASAICAAAETYVGQVEAGVGVVPALGGCKELLRRVVSPIVKRSPNADPLPFLRQVFEMVALAKVSGSAEEARQWGFLTPTDRIVMNPSHLLYEAKRLVLDMIESGWRPVVRGKEIWAMGTTALAVLEAGIWGFREAGYISGHDALIAGKTAYILCGGRLSRPQWVDPQFILDLERESFLSLLGTQKTLDRVLHMLKTGKPLRN
jgi:3-hydroxyacyl-CoA dehydrogenase